MKKLFLILLSVAFTQLSYAQWIADGNNVNITNTNTGYVGIGTTPLYNLSVNGDIALAKTGTSPNYTDAGRFLIDGSTVYPSIYFRRSGDNEFTAYSNASPTLTFGATDVTIYKPLKTNTINIASANGLLEFDGTAFKTRSYYSLRLESDYGGTNGNHAIQFYTNGNEKARITKDGYWGIGTPSPTKLLDVNGSSLMNGGLSLKLTNNADYSGFISFNRDGDNGSIYNPQHSAFQINSRPTWLEFQVYNGDGNQVTSNALAINNVGNVGIGTSSPQGKLDIFTNTNTATTPLLSIRSDFHTAGNYGMIRFGDYTQTTDYQKGAIIYESVAGSARGKFHIALENTDGNGSVSLSDAKLTVLSNGNVGIGTTTPDRKLTIQRTSNISNTELSFKDQAGNTQGTFGIESATTNDLLIAGTAGMRFFTGSTLGANGIPTSEIMRLTATGKVGIGTTDTQNFQLANSTYKLAVGGNVIAEQVTVKLQANWPDYVFKPTYTLTPLSELKTYIDQNHHLPEIPSEKEVAEKGLNLGEMNKLLTKKVEELTLYLIELSKTVKDQQKEINQLKKSN